jgi:GNAT superfamily N-acetyltransferase
MAVYSITRYPATFELRDGTAVTLRPMTRDDAAVLGDFFLRIPEEDRFFMKDDVTDPGVIDSWAQRLDYDRTLPLLGFVGDRMVADAALVRHRGGYRRDCAEIRVVIEPEFRGKGLGTILMRELITVAWDAELDHVDFEMVSDIQSEAIEAVEGLGALDACTLSGYVKYEHGKAHDLVFLRLPLGKWWEWSNF